MLLDAIDDVQVQRLKGWMADRNPKTAPRGGRLHILRHTSCSRLASRDVPAITLQHLAGHAGLETTPR